MKAKASPSDYWKAIDRLHPKHKMGGSWHNIYKGTDAYCTDDAPNGWGNFGCKRCDMIMSLEIRRIKIWPRSEKAS